MCVPCVTSELLKQILITRRVLLPSRTEGAACVDVSRGETVSNCVWAKLLYMIAGNL